jgi:glucose/arabinose dehydrogenase
MMRSLALAMLVLAGCPSGASVRGVERVGTAQPTSAHASDRPGCRGKSVDAWAPPGFCVTEFAADLSRPRHLVFSPNGDLLVATRTGIVVLWDTDHDGRSDEHERATVGAPDVSQQGVAISPDARWLYVADSRAVRRMPFTPAMRHSEGAGAVVVPDVPLTIDHPYRTITFDAQGRLYLVVGATDNLTPGEGATVMRYTLPEAIPSGGVAYASGEKFAVGLRNGEALAWAPDGSLWAFVNGRDFLRPPGTAESFYLDHPGDWIYRLSNRPGTFYGFPSCWVLGPAPWGERRDPASQWADPDANGGHDDRWCQDPANVHPAAGALPAHTAPLGATFYSGTLFPPKYRNTFFVTSHGSWNRHGEQRGRTILAVHVQGERVVGIEPVVGEKAKNGDLVEGIWSERPVGIAQGPDGALYFTSDETGRVLRLGYAP